MAIREQLRQEAIEHNQKSQQQAKDKKAKAEWLEFTTTYNLPYDVSLQDEEVADLYKQWQANRKTSPAKVNKDIINKNKELANGGRSKYMTFGADGKAIGKNAYDEKGNLIGRYDPESIRRDVGGTPTYLMNKVPTIVPIPAQEQQFRADMKRHEQQVSSQVAKERGPMPWEKGNTTASKKGTRENPYTTNTEVKGAKAGEWCLHKGKPYQLRQADIDWANGKRPAASITSSPKETPPGKPSTPNTPSTPSAPGIPSTPNKVSKQVVQLKRTNDWRTLHKLRKAGIPVVDRGDYYETDRAIYMKPKKENGRVITSINDTNARKSHFVRNRNGKGGQWVDYTPEEMAQRGKTAEDEVLAARSGTPLQTIKPNGQFVDSADDVKGNKLNPNILAGVQAGDFGRG